MSYVLMYVSMTPRQEQTLRALENVTPRLATFHGYEQPGSERECDQPDSIWVTFGGIYVRIEENGDTERDVLEDFMGFEPDDFTDNFIDTRPGYVAGA